MLCLFPEPFPFLKALVYQNDIHMQYAAREYGLNLVRLGLASTNRGAMLFNFGHKEEWAKKIDKFINQTYETVLITMRSKLTAVYNAVAVADHIVFSFCQ